MKAEDLLIILFCEVDDWVRAHPLPARPGPAPACADSEVLTFALARELLGYDSERRFLRVLRDDFGHLFPRLPAQSELNRRARWLWGALERLRRHYLARLPPPTEGWHAFDTTPLPVKHPSRVRRADDWELPDGTRAGFGRCAAKAEWFYGFRLAALTPLVEPVPVCWALVPAAVDEREVLRALTDGRSGLRVMADKGLRSAAVARELAGRDILLLTPPTAGERAALPGALRRFIAAHRNRIEGTFATGKDQLHLERHRALTAWGLLTRLAGKLAALTLRAVWRRAGRELD
jgi:hypothetical protein